MARILGKQGGKSKVTIHKQTSAGEPQPRAIVRNFPKTVTRRLQARKSIRTLIKSNPVDGLSGADVATLPQDAAGNKVANGVALSGSGGTKGATVMSKSRPSSTQQPKGSKRVQTPRPLGTGRIRNPYRGKN